MGLIQLAAAQADPLPTFTATSGSANIGVGPSWWSVSGNGFAVGGSAVGPEYFVFDATPGSDLALYLPFEDVGLRSYMGNSSGATFGSVTINGATDSVQLEVPPQIDFQTAGVTIPYGANPVISLPATLANSGLAVECLGSGLVPMACTGNYGNYGLLPVAQINIDVPGVVTFYGVNSDPTDPAQGVVNITEARFTSLPEPVSGTLACLGLMLVAGAAKLRRKKA